MDRKKAYFRFEASTLIGAGHAIRSCVIADALVNEGWDCYLVTSEESYHFIKDLDRFKRIDPDFFYQNPDSHHLLVIDHYGLDSVYEKHFRPYAEKILVIDDLANRPHDCDILLDQTYGRDVIDYENLVPKSCQILTGSDYVLLRQEFICMRPKALQKRREVKEVKRILISMGGGSSSKYILKALEMIKESNFTGSLDIVLGFQENDKADIENFLITLPNEYTFHVNPDMAQLMYEADLAIGAAGSSVWERCCLGLPQVLIQTADNQKDIFSFFEKIEFNHPLIFYLSNNYCYDSEKINIDGFGINRLFLKITAYEKNLITFREIIENDKKKIYEWQQIKEVRHHFNNSNPPSMKEHTLWFSNRLKLWESPYWIICFNGKECGVISLIYNHTKNKYELSWFIIPEHRGKKIGMNSLIVAMKIIKPFKIYAYVKKNNIISQKALLASGFFTNDNMHYISEKS